MAATSDCSQGSSSAVRRGWRSASSRWLPAVKSARSAARSGKQFEAQQEKAVELRLGQGKVPIWWAGFWVAMTKTGPGRARVSAPPSPAALPSPPGGLWVLGVARLISSASTTWAKIGPGKRKALFSRSKSETPVISAGSRSLVNWMREKRSQAGPGHGPGWFCRLGNVFDRGGGPGPASRRVPSGFPAPCPGRPGRPPGAGRRWGVRRQFWGKRLARTFAGGFLPILLFPARPVSVLRRPRARLAPAELAASRENMRIALWRQAWRFAAAGIFAVNSGFETRRGRLAPAAWFSALPPCRARRRCPDPDPHVDAPSQNQARCCRSPATGRPPPEETARRGLAGASAQC